MMSGARAALAVTLLSVLALAGCDALLGGEEVARIPLKPAAQDGYEPVRILLKPDMNPVGLSLHADFAWGRHEEAGRWNSYRAELRGERGVIASREFQVNSPERPNASSSAPPASLVFPMLVAEVPAEGEYELTVRALHPPVVTIESPQLGVRMRVPRP